jgi:hypothetical protein
MKNGVVLEKKISSFAFLFRIGKGMKLVKLTRENEFQYNI